MSCTQLIRLNTKKYSFFILNLLKQCSWVTLNYTFKHKQPTELQLLSNFLEYAHNSNVCIFCLSWGLQTYLIKKHVDS